MVTATVFGVLDAVGALMLTVAVYVPTGNEPRDALSESVAGAVVVLRLAVSHPAPDVYATLVDNPLSVPTLPLEIRIPVAAGSASPRMAVKDRADAESTMDGAAAIVRVTGTVTLAMPATGVATVIVAL